VVDAWEAEEAGVIWWLVVKAIARSTSLCSCGFGWKEPSFYTAIEVGDKGEAGGVNGRELTRRRGCNCKAASMEPSPTLVFTLRRRSCRLQAAGSWPLDDREELLDSLPLSCNVMLQPRSKSLLC
jgi:hypothetical protein